tara:strand:- start:522 stop:908 length:387 start_codon:yes stop_codon:yes gene_type:complete
MKGINMKKYSYTATRDFTQSYMITVEAKNEAEADSKVYALKYNCNNEWSERGKLQADDKLIDIQRCAVENPADNYCEDCEGKGYFEGVISSGLSDPKDPYHKPHIERCDTCMTFEDDVKAKEYHEKHT